MNPRHAGAIAFARWLIVLLIAAIPRLVLAADQRRLTIPADKGTTWIYSGTARWWGSTRPDEVGIKASPIRNWQTKVIEAGSRGDVTASVVQGLPNDLAWYGFDSIPPPASLTLVVQSTAGLFMKTVSSDEADQSLEDALAQKLKFDMDEDQMLRFPVQVDACLSTEPNALKAKRWCWHVLSVVKGEFGSGWELEYQTLPDRQLVDIVPGVGITRYVYHHNGTVADTDVHLMRLPR